VWTVKVLAFLLLQEVGAAPQLKFLRRRLQFQNRPSNFTRIPKFGGGGHTGIGDQTVNRNQSTSSSQQIEELQEERVPRFQQSHPIEHNLVSQDSKTQSVFHKEQRKGFDGFSNEKPSESKGKSQLALELYQNRQSLDQHKPDVITTETVVIATQTSLQNNNEKEKPTWEKQIAPIFATHAYCHRTWNMEREKRKLEMFEEQKTQFEEKLKQLNRQIEDQKKRLEYIKQKMEEVNLKSRTSTETPLRATAATISTQQTTTTTKILPIITVSRVTTSVSKT